MAEITDGCFHCYNSSAEVFTERFFQRVFSDLDVIYSIKLPNAVTLGGAYDRCGVSAGSRDLLQWVIGYLCGRQLIQCNVPQLVTVQRHVKLLPAAVSCLRSANSSQRSLV